MTKAYVVTAGSYSDYHVVAVFSSEEKAKAFMGNAPEDEYRVEEYLMDEDRRPVVFGPKWVVLLGPDGSVRKQYAFDAVDITEEHYAGERGQGQNCGVGGEPNTYGVFYGISYVGPEHAMKLAVEERQKALREHPEWFAHLPAEAVK